MSEPAKIWPLHFWALTVHETLYLVELASEGVDPTATFVGARDLHVANQRQIGSVLAADTCLEIMHNLRGLVFFPVQPRRDDRIVRADELNSDLWTSSTSNICALFDNAIDAVAALNNSQVYCRNWERSLQGCSAWTLKMLQDHPATQGEHARLLIDPRLMAELWVAKELEQVVLDLADDDEPE